MIASALRQGPDTQWPVFPVSQTLSVSCYVGVCLVMSSRVKTIPNEAVIQAFPYDYMRY